MNSGVQTIIEAFNVLKQDMGAVVIAGVGIALVGIGAIAAWTLFHRMVDRTVSNSINGKYDGY